MIGRPARIVSITLAAVVSLVSISGAQTVHWGAKAGINSSSVNAVPDYYDWVLCCHPLFPDAMVDATSSAGFTAGGFVALPIHTWFGVQGEILFSRKRHSVDLQPYEAIQATFTRDYVEAAGLVKLEFPVTSQNHVYVAGRSERLSSGTVFLEGQSSPRASFFDVIRARLFSPQIQR
jgi:hypothetical protein